MPFLFDLTSILLNDSINFALAQIRGKMRIGGEGSCWRKAIWFSVDYCAIVPFQKFFSVWMDAFLLIWKRPLLPPNLIPTGNAGATFRESFLAGSARARKPGRHHWTWMKRLPDSWWLGEAIGDDPQSWRVEAKANMGCLLYTSPSPRD